MGHVRITTRVLTILHFLSHFSKYYFFGSTSIDDNFLYFDLHVETFGKVVLYAEAVFLPVLDGHRELHDGVAQVADSGQAHQHIDAFSQAKETSEEESESEASGFGCVEGGESSGYIVREHHGNQSWKQNKQSVDVVTTSAFTNH